MNATDNPWTQSQLDTFRYTILGLGIPSILCNLFLIISALLFAELRTFPARMVTYLSIAVTISITSALISGVKGLPEIFESTLSCHVQSIGLMFGFQAGFIWFAFIVFNVHRTICFEKVDGEKFEKWYHLIAWGTALASTLINFLSSPIGPSGPWCMVDITKTETTLAQLLGSYTPLFIVWIYGFICLILIGIEVNRILKRHPNLSHKTQARLYFYGIVFLLMAPLGLISRVYQHENPSSPSFALNWLYTFSVTFQGIFLFLLFGMTQNMYKLYRGLCGRGNTRSVPASTAMVFEATDRVGKSSTLLVGTKRSFLSNSSQNESMPLLG